MVSHAYENISKSLNSDIPEIEWHSESSEDDMYAGLGQKLSAKKPAARKKTVSDVKFAGKGLINCAENASGKTGESEDEEEDVEDEVSHYSR